MSEGNRKADYAANYFPWRNPKFREAELIARWKWLKEEAAKKKAAIAKAKAKGGAA